MESLELIQHPISTIDSSQLYLVLKALTMVKIGDPLLSLRFNEVVESGAVFEFGRGGADLSPGTVEISLGPAESAPDGFKLVFERLDSCLGRHS